MAKSEIPQCVEDYTSYVNSVRQEVNSKYNNLIRCLEQNKANCNIKIDDIESKYKNDEDIKMQEIVKLESFLEKVDIQLDINSMQDIQESIKGQTNAKLKTVKEKRNDHKIEFIWSSSIEGIIENLGQLNIKEGIPFNGNIEQSYTENSCNDQKFENKDSISSTSGPLSPNTIIDDVVQKPDSQDIFWKDNSFCNAKKERKVSKYARGNQREQLNRPAGVDINLSSGSLYVADNENNRIQVYNISDGKFKFSFNHQSGYIFTTNCTNRPWGVCCSLYKVYVTESNLSQMYSALKMFDIEGKFLAEVCKFGNENGQFNDPTGLAIDKSRDEVYVCDSLNHRVQVFSGSLIFLAVLSQAKLYKPRDIHVNDHEIYILDASDPCLHIFNKKTGDLKTSILRKGIGQEVYDAWFFTIDSDRNILISDKKDGSLKVFTNDGKRVVARIGSLEEPTGVSVGQAEDIIVMCNSNSDACLNIFSPDNQLKISTN